MFCLQNGASFGKSQLLNGPTLANQNKNKKARKFKYLLSSSQILFKNETFLSDFQTFLDEILEQNKKSDKLYISAIATSCNIKLIAMGIFPIPPSPKKILLT